MRRIFSLAALVLFSGPMVCTAQQVPAATSCPRTFGELYGTVRGILFATSDEDVMSVATLYFEPSWGNTESQITIQFPDKGAPIVTSFRLAPKQRSISFTVSSSIRAGHCDASSIAKRVRVVRKSIPMNEGLAMLIDRLWKVEIVPRPAHSVNLDATLYVLDVKGQDNLRVATDDHDSPIARWMDEIDAAVNGQW